MRRYRLSRSLYLTTVRDLNDNQIICAEVGALARPLCIRIAPLQEYVSCVPLVRRDASLDISDSSSSSSPSSSMEVPKSSISFCSMTVSVCQICGRLHTLYHMSYLCHNHDEILFGTSEEWRVRRYGHTPKQSWAGALLVRKAAPMLEGALQDPDTLPLMAQYGDVTVISIINNASGGKGSGSLLAGEAGTHGHSIPGCSPRIW